MTPDPRAFLAWCKRNGYDPRPWADRVRLWRCWCKYGKA